MQKQSTIDRLEEKFLFQVSRYFFLALAMISMLVLLVGVLYFGWSVVPVNRVPYPKEVTLTAKDVKDNLKSMSQTEHQASESNSNADNSNDPDQAKFRSYIYTLRQLMPQPEYLWDGSWYEIGITQRLTNFAGEFRDMQECNQAFAQLCSILRAFPEKERLEPLESFMQLYLQKRNDRAEQIKKIDSDYTLSMAAKAVGKSGSLVVVVSAISTMAFLALFLVLLSVQRNITKISMLIPNQQRERYLMNEGDAPLAGETAP